MTKPEAAFDLVLHAVADPIRRRILQALKEKNAGVLKTETGLCALDIEERVRLSQSTVSHHMAVLRKAGLVVEKKRGLYRLYDRNENAIAQLLRHLKHRLS